MTVPSRLRVLPPPHIVACIWYSNDFSPTSPWPFRVVFKFSLHSHNVACVWYSNDFSPTSPWPFRVVFKFSLHPHIVACIWYRNDLSPTPPFVFSFGTPTSLLASDTWYSNDPKPACRHRSSLDFRTCRSSAILQCVSLPVLSLLPHRSSSALSHCCLYLIPCYKLVFFFSFQVRSHIWQLNLDFRTLSSPPYSLVFFWGSLF